MSDCCATGSMFETSKRWRVPYLIYVLAAVMLGEIAFNGELFNPPLNALKLSI